MLDIKHCIVFFKRFLASDMKFIIKFVIPESATQSQTISLDMALALAPAPTRVATKIFEDFGGVLNKAFIRGWEPVSIIRYTRPGTCINRPLH